MRKHRLSATVEGELVRAGRRAVSEGRADSLSGWVNDALRRQAEHDQRLKALSGFIREHEAEHGAITDKEIRDARRYFSARTTAVRPRPTAQRRAVSRKRGAA